MNNTSYSYGLTAAVAPWISSSFPIIRIVLISLLIIISASIIVLILMQPAKQEGVGAISGSADTFFSKNKGRSREGMLLRLTIIFCVIAFVLALLFHITLSIYQGTIGEAEAFIKTLLK